MLWAQAHSFRQQSKLAISLGWIGGYTNSVAVLTCHLAVSHVTGSTTWFGEAISAWDLKSSFFLGFLLFTFWLGAVVSGLMTEGAKRKGIRSRYIAPLAVEAALLIIFAIGVQLLVTQRISGGRMNAAWILGIGTMAMGLQNATITRISGNVIRTTHLTGVFTDLGLEFVYLFFWWRDKTRSHRPRRMVRAFRVALRHPSFLRLALLSSIFLSFLFGVIAASLIHHRIPSFAMVLPILFLLFILYMDWRQPIADTRELDRVKDSELESLGLSAAILPPELGIYRITPQINQQQCEPDFASWADALKPQWRTIVLAITPTIHLSSNALLDLNAAIDKLIATHRTLILGGITPSQYKLLDYEGLIEKIGAHHVCPDLEFAIAMGMQTITEWRAFSLPPASLSQ